MPDLSPPARRVLAHLEALAQQTPAAPRPTVTELGAQLDLDRRVLDGALGQLDELGLIRIRGGLSTHESHVEPSETAFAALRDDPSPISP